MQQPVLGICLGQQLLCSYSEESETDCLGIFKAKVKKFPALQVVPHMGWNSLQAPSSALLSGLNSHDNVYFVHSYYCELGPHSIAACDYILPFSAAMHKDNFYATQFHPEKSGLVGEKILLNFLKL